MGGSRNMDVVAPRYIDKRVEICLHALFVFVLFHYQMQTLRALSREWADRLPLSPNGVDLTDTQWRDFRNGLPLLTLAMGAFVGVSRLVRRFSPAGGRVHATFYAVCGVGFVVYLHGAYAFFPIAFAAAFYVASHALTSAASRAGGKAHTVAAAAVWVLMLAALLLAEWCKGWYDVRRSALFSSDVWLAIVTADQRRAVGVFFQRRTGVYRWHVGFNMLALRILSFCLDLNETRRLEGGEGAPASVGSPREGTLVSYTHRQNTPRPLKDYSFVHFLAYCLYIPCYIAGPTTTFNAFVSHVQGAQTTHDRRYVVVYALRWLFCLGLLEVGTRNVYVWALSKNRSFTENADPLHMAMVGFFLLNGLWLKFAVIWRHARLFCLLDGIEVPENLTRCVNNNFTIAGFWRNWHRSYNAWLIRYIYLPLGGRTYRLLNVWPVFLFVAMWHDLQLNLLKWGVVMAVFMMPETLCIAYFGESERTAWLRRKPWWRYVKAVVGTLNITVLVGANLVGFGFGASADSLLQRVLSLSAVLGWAFVEFFSATCLMLEVREWEAVQEERRKDS